MYSPSTFLNKNDTDIQWNLHWLQFPQFINMIRVNKVTNQNFESLTSRGMSEELYANSEQHQRQYYTAINT